MRWACNEVYLWGIIILWEKRDLRSLEWSTHSITMAPCFNLTHWGRDKNGRLFADNTFKGIFFNENVRISIKISLKFVPKGRINNIPALVQIMAWCRPGDKPLSEPMMVSLSKHICVTRPQWVKDAIIKTHLSQNRLPLNSWNRHMEKCTMQSIFLPRNCQK